MKWLGWLCALALVACGEDSDGAAGTPGTTVEVVAAADHPLDAAPSPDGRVIYFVAAANGADGVYRAETKPVLLAPIQGPTSLVVSADGATLYVGNANGLLRVPAEGGTATPVAGTEGHAVAMLDRADRLYFAGTDPQDRPGVFAIEAGGGTAERLVDLAAAPTGLLRLGTDDFAVALATGEVVRAVDGAIAPLYDGETLGAPTGMARAPDGRLMISSLSTMGRAQVVLLDLGTGEVEIFSEGIGARTAAGGLHGAGAVYAWADSTLEGGRVFRIRF